jgi:hypothetical protein
MTCREDSITVIPAKRSASRKRVSIEHLATVQRPFGFFFRGKDDGFK